MNRQHLPWEPAPAGEIEFSDQGTPRSQRFGDIYYSDEQGISESLHVFVHGSGLPERWRQHRSTTFCIGETGFGSGLNFLLSWREWQAAEGPKPRLHYLSFERYPLKHRDMERALSNWVELTPFKTQLLQQYPGLVPGQHRLIFEQGQIILDLWWHDAGEALTHLSNWQQPFIDAWYLDGFAPSRNADMWHPNVLRATAALSRTGATVATFTVAGAVRRTLQEAGFSVEKVPGYGRKRECLRGVLASRQQSGTPQNPAWDVPAPLDAPPSEVVIMGAGLAGCATAAALNRRGIRTILLERGCLAGEGSGNSQGILYHRIHREHSPLADFGAQSYLHAVASYQRLFACGQLQEGVDGALCGSFHQQSQQAGMPEVAHQLALVPEYAQYLDAATANNLLGVEQLSDGFWFPRSGWLNPPAVCKALINSSLSELYADCGQISLERIASGWRASTHKGRVWEAACVVLATGTETMNFEQCSWLPLQAIRGQTTEVPSAAVPAGLQAAFCHEGYIAPARSGFHSIGATFDLSDDDRMPRSADSELNLQLLAGALPNWEQALAKLTSATLEARVGFRCASPDYLPLAGRAPDWDQFVTRFAALRRNARLDIGESGGYLPGLFIVTALGSRGLTSAPLLGELIASNICQEPPPMCRDLTRALNPGRFIIRDLRRNRI
ncbi:MAG: bifunctional tRNA (5-methylaminomethyl-2-thiouridine)(34)-methyltransferase MnmD/FAD-dependent 5-carboxymethylaminomethyl-2-thiouridine(34) oxidoreductase MnmC [Pseudomonadota bacterium]